MQEWEVGFAGLVTLYAQSSEMKGRILCIIKNIQDTLKKKPYILEQMEYIFTERTQVEGEKTLP